jgi:hypothetical protein
MERRVPTHPAEAPERACRECTRTRPLGARFRRDLYREWAWENSQVFSRPVRYAKLTAELPHIHAIWSTDYRLLVIMIIPYIKLRLSPDLNCAKLCFVRVNGKNYPLHQWLDWRKRVLVYYLNRWCLLGLLRVQMAYLRLEMFRNRLRVFGLENGYLAPNKGNLTSQKRHRSAAYNHLVKLIDVLYKRHISVSGTAVSSAPRSKAHS